MSSYKADFLQTCLSASAIKFGQFTLKSGRQSPYFFNAGLFHRADLLRSLSLAYAKSIKEYADTHNLAFDVLFGPAYKGIPLAAATLDKLADLDEGQFGKCSYSFNRKEAKDHGEGGKIVGSTLKDKKVMIIDDVITAGTAIREAIDIIEREGGQLMGIIVAFDRMETAPSKSENQNDSRMSAIGQVQKEHNIPVLAILTLADVIGILKGSGSAEEAAALTAYREKYGASG
ncbi:MAG: orotate phosphoribosyltransferase [Vezdaea aestivalis]|nr:MAG: orotate phosphoribosyltransferase [Vezdaea aestivalis]